jgi:hypothetical protein
MENDLVTSPKIDKNYRDRMKAMVPELQLGKYSDVVGFLITVYDLLFEGQRFRNADERISFVKNLLKDKEFLARENIMLSDKLKRLQKVIDE